LWYALNLLLKSLEKLKQQPVSGYLRRNIMAAGDNPLTGRNQKVSKKPKSCFGAGDFSLKKSTFAKVFLKNLFLYLVRFQGAPTTGSRILLPGQFP
jgi:hypothetical protein